MTSRLVAAVFVVVVLTGGFLLAGTPSPPVVDPQPIAVDPQPTIADQLAIDKGDISIDGTWPGNKGGGIRTEIRRIGDFAPDGSFPVGVRRLVKFPARATPGPMRSRVELWRGLGGCGDCTPEQLFAYVEPETFAPERLEDGSWLLDDTEVIEVSGYVPFNWDGVSIKVISEEFDDQTETWTTRSLRTRTIVAPR